jgi:hypothetical protein
MIIGFLLIEFIDDLALKLEFQSATNDKQNTVLIYYVVIRLGEDKSEKIVKFYSSFLTFSRRLFCFWIQPCTCRPQPPVQIFTVLLTALNVGGFKWIAISDGGSVWSSQLSMPIRLKRNIYMALGFWKDRRYIDRRSFTMKIRDGIWSRDVVTWRSVL